MCVNIYIYIYRYHCICHQNDENFNYSIYCIFYIYIYTYTYIYISNICNTQQGFSIHRFFQKIEIIDLIFKRIFLQIVFAICKPSKLAGFGLFWGLFAMSFRFSYVKDDHHLRSQPSSSKACAASSMIWGRTRKIHHQNGENLRSFCGGTVTYPSEPMIHGFSEKWVYLQ